MTISDNDDDDDDDDDDENNEWCFCDGLSTKVN